LVVGVTSDFIAGPDLARLEVEKAVDDVSIATESLQLGATGTGFPLELAFEDVAISARLAITIRGYDLGNVLRVVRHMHTEAVGGPTKLARVHLQHLCTLTTEQEIQQGAAPSAPTCDEQALTCIAGQCGSAYLTPSKQVDYAPDWAGVIDCKPAGAGTAEVILGFGPGYTAAQDYDVGQVEAGNQGGYHVWFGARVRNLGSSDALIAVGGDVPALAASIGPFESVGSLVGDVDGYCRLPAVYLRLDSDTAIGALLGQEMRATLSITDEDGDVGSDELWVTLSNSAN
jgi:hypothetical protein